MSLLSHDGWKYKTAKERNETDKAHAKKLSARGGRSNNARRTKKDNQYLDNWDGWYDNTKRPWHDAAATSNGSAPAAPDSPPPGDSVADTGGSDITKRFECRRFGCDKRQKATSLDLLAIIAKPIGITTRFQPSL